MSEAEHSLRLSDGLRAGDAAMDRAFWNCYGSGLLRLAEKRLSPQMQARVGPEDVVQSACRTFMRRARAGEFQVADSAALWKILCVITLTKVREQVRYHRRQKRNVAQEIRLARPTNDSAGPALDLADTRTEPAEAVAIAD